MNKEERISQIKARIKMLGGEYECCEIEMREIEEESFRLKSELQELGESNAD